MDLLRCAPASILDHSFLWPACTASTKFSGCQPNQKHSRYSPHTKKRKKKLMKKENQSYTKSNENCQLPMFLEIIICSITYSVLLATEHYSMLAPPSRYLRHATDQTTHAVLVKFLRSKLASRRQQNDVPAAHRLPPIWRREKLQSRRHPKTQLRCHVIVFSSF